LGDYNDDLHESIVTGLQTSYSNFVADTLNYNPITLPLSLAGAKSTTSFDGVIDNQIISNELNADYLPGSQHVITPFIEIPNYASTTSDHLAVASRFRFTPATVNFTTQLAQVIEGPDSVLVQLQLSKPLDTDKIITVQVQNGAGAVYGSDYVTSPVTSNDVIHVTIPAGSTTANIIINVLDDTQDEQDEQVTLQITPSTGILLNDSTSTFSLTIIDNDLPSINFVESEVSREEGSGAYTVKLKLTSAQTASQTVTIQATNGQGVVYGNFFDYTTSPVLAHGKLTLTIPAGKDEVEFTVTPNKDLIHENNEVITFSIASVSNGIVKGSSSILKFTIIDTPVCLPVFTVFPNPTLGVVNICTLPSNEDQIVEGTLIDPRGEVLSSVTGTVAQISEQFTNALQGKKRGVYIIKLKECDTTITIRLLKL
ncbi:MAG TPA: Calx-beta domain-containing protein, partial [Cyclobacteriaceae bacterium]